MYLTMLFTQTAYIGIDLTGRKAFTYAVLNADLGLLALTDGDLEDVLTFIGGQASAFVAVNAPAKPNQGHVRMLLESKSLTTDKSPLRGADMRLAALTRCDDWIWAGSRPSRRTMHGRCADDG